MRKIEHIPAADRGVEKSELPAAGVDPTAGVLVANPEEAWLEPKRDAGVPNDVDWGEKPEEPNKFDAGADTVGVEKRKEEDAAGAEDGVLNNESPLLEDAADGTMDGCIVLIAGATELLKAPLVGCEEPVGKCNVGWTLLAAASRLAVSLLLASRNGSFASPPHRWSARYAFFIDSTYWWRLSTCNPNNDVGKNKSYRLAMSEENNYWYMLKCLSKRSSSAKDNEKFF